MNPAECCVYYRLATCHMHKSCTQVPVYHIHMCLYEQDLIQNWKHRLSIHNTLHGLKMTVISVGNSDAYKWIHVIGSLILIMDEDLLFNGSLNYRSICPIQRVSKHTWILISLLLHSESLKVHDQKSLIMFCFSNYHTRAPNSVFQFIAQTIWIHTALFYFSSWYLTTLCYL